MYRIEDIYNLTMLKTSVIKLINSFKLEDLKVEGEDNTYEVFVDTISSGASGTHQPEEIAKAFDMKMLSMSFDIVNDINVDKTTKRYEIAKDECEFAWETIDRWAAKLADELNRKLKVLDSDNGYFCFGCLEADGSYGLFYRFERGN